LIDLIRANEINKTMNSPIFTDKATAPGKGNYHHGELRELLMDLALARIAIDGTEKFSLRALAREANVFPPLHRSAILPISMRCLPP